MDQEKLGIFINHFKKSFEEVTKELIENEYVSCEKTELDNEAKLCVLIGITGKSKGRISLNCTLETAKKFAIAMNFGDELDDPKDLYLYIAELANIFCGRAVTYINNDYNDREVWLAPPAIFSGKNLEIITPKINTETIYYTGQPGSFIVEIGFEGDS